MFLLCTFADRNYWPSALEVLAYPPGCSFYRPFSYRQAYVTAGLWNIISHPDQLAPMLANANWNKGIVGIRFREEAQAAHRSQFVPLRRVAITHVRLSDTAQVFFRVLDYAQLKRDDHLKSLDLHQIVDSAQPEDMLFLDVPATRSQEFEEITYASDMPPKLLDRLVDDFALSPPARDNLRWTGILRLLGVRARGDNAYMPLVNLESKTEPVFGYKFVTGKVYDADLSYRRLVQAGDRPEPFAYDYRLINPREDCETGRQQIRTSGNYRDESIWIRPTREQPGPIQLEWVGVKKVDGLPVDPPREKAIGLRVPTRSFARFWTLRRGVIGLLGLVTLVGATIVFIAALQTAEKGSVSETLSVIGSLLAGTASTLITLFFTGHRA